MVRRGLSIEYIRQALAGPLPGQVGQWKMAPEPPPDMPDRWSIPDGCREAAVLVFLYPGSPSEMGENPEDHLHVILTQRHEYPGVHSGQVSFPGGKREAGESLRTTALRETMEEIGIAPETVQVLGELSAMYIPPSNFCIYPFVGYSPTRPRFEPDAKEVAKLIEVPLTLLNDPALHKETLWDFPGSIGRRRVRYFDVFGHKVWGATAMILSEFLTLLDERYTR